MLISQCLYYNRLNGARTKRQQSVVSVSEEQPLLSRRRSSENIGLPGSRRRSSARSASNSELRRDSLSKILEEDDSPGANPWLRNTLSVLAVAFIGAAGWTIAWQSKVWKPTPLDGDEQKAAEIAIGAQVLGYISAICYLG